jgi:hypothetical protein
LLPLRQFGQPIGLTQAFADAHGAPRDPDQTESTFLEMVPPCIPGILALRRDGPAFRDQAAGVEVDKQEVALVGLIDRSNQGDSPNLLWYL